MNFDEQSSMRTNIDIDDTLINDVLKLTGLKTKKDAVELGLKTLIRLKKQENIKKFRGKLEWTGDLDDMRTNS
jgi:Arc/MetJ family transcription regulator